MENKTNNEKIFVTTSIIVKTLDLSIKQPLIDMSATDKFIFIAYVINTITVKEKNT